MHSAGRLPTGESNDEVVVAGLRDVHVVLEPLAGSRPTDVAAAAIRVGSHFRIDGSTAAVARVRGVRVEEAIECLSLDAQRSERLADARTRLLYLATTTTRGESESATKQRARARKHARDWTRKSTNGRLTTVPQFDFNVLHR